MNNLIGLFETGCAVNVVNNALIETLISQVTLQSRSSAKIAAVIISKDNAMLEQYL
jgi:hypothetical protein